MTDREKVIEELEHCRQLDFEMKKPTQVAIDNALALLKEQNPVEPKLVGVNTWTCGKCGALLGWEEFSQSGLELVKYKYCPHCGRAVKLDERHGNSYDVIRSTCS